MKYRYVSISILFILCLTALPAVSQVTGPGGPFFASLVETLRAQGWSEAELEQFGSVASDLEWRETEGVNPEVVAPALAYFRDGTSEAVVSENAAFLALELAKSARAMQDVGFRSVEIGRAAVAGTRGAVAEIEQLEGRPRDVAGAVETHIVLSIREQVRVTAGGRGPAVARRILDRISPAPRLIDVDQVPPVDVPGGP